MSKSILLRQKLKLIQEQQMKAAEENVLKRKARELEKEPGEISPNKLLEEEYNKVKLEQHSVTSSQDNKPRLTEKRDFSRHNDLAVDRRDSRDSRDYREPIREPHRDSRDYREPHRDYRDSRESRNPRELYRESRDSRTPREPYRELYRDSRDRRYDDRNNRYDRPYSPPQRPYERRDYRNYREEYPQRPNDARDSSNRNEFNKRPRSPEKSNFMEGDRSLKTVIVSQINTRALERDIFHYFDRVARVKEVKLIYDKSSNRSKGIAYIEFLFGDSISKALDMNGSIFMGGPLTVEKVNSEMTQDNYVDLSGQLVVSNLHTSILEEDLKDLFEEFGSIKSILMAKDQNGQSSGKAFIVFENKKDAELAITELNEFELMGEKMAVELQTSTVVNATKKVKYSKKDASSRVMQVLASKINQGLDSRCLTFTNMFTKETLTNDLKEIKQDVEIELKSFGRILHFDLNVEDELIYCKFEQLKDAKLALEKSNGRFFDGKIVKCSFISEQIYGSKYPESSFK